VDDRVIQLHVDLAGDNDDVVDRVGPVVAGRQARRELQHAEDRTVRQRGARLAQARVVLAVVVGGEALRGPHVDARGPRAPREGVRGDFVDLDDRLAARVVPGDHSPHLECHA
jgi:hypothetical protein